MVPAPHPPALQASRLKYLAESFRIPVLVSLVWAWCGPAWARRCTLATRSLHCTAARRWQGRDLAGHSHLASAASRALTDT